MGGEWFYIRNKVVNQEEYDKLISDKIDRMFKHTWICKECGRENEKAIRVCPCNKKKK